MHWGKALDFPRRRMTRPFDIDNHPCPPVETYLVTQTLDFALTERLALHELGDPHIWIFRKCGHGGGGVSVVRQDKVDGVIIAVTSLVTHTHTLSLSS